jgi:2',3'-cyclic-nucleotide 2'-phosphodiesterase (5'-nucleotidase family)
MDDPTVYQRVPFGGATLLPPNDTARAEAARLLAEEACDSVVAMTHQSMQQDRALLAQESPIALVLGGHEHQVFLERVHDTWIVKAGSDAVHAVVIDLAWGDGPHPTVTRSLEDVARYPEDAALRAQVDVHLERVKALGSATLLTLEPGQELSSVGTRVRQTTLGTLLATKIRQALHADACVFNGGGIRGARTYHDRISYGDLETEVPFANEFVCAPLPGALLQQAIAFSRAHAPVEFGGFLQVCDAVELDAEGTIVRVHDAPFDATQLYRVALVRNLFTGMDGVEPLIDFAREHADAIPEAGSGRDVKLVLLESFARSLWKQLGGFDRIDADRDGIVNAADLERSLAGHSGSAAAAAGILLRALDQNHDGQMTRDEDVLVDD